MLGEYARPRKVFFPSMNVDMSYSQGHQNTKNKQGGLQSTGKATTVVTSLGGQRKWNPYQQKSQEPVHQRGERHRSEHERQRVPGGQQPERERPWKPRAFQ